MKSSDNTKQAQNHARPTNNVTGFWVEIGGTVWLDVDQVWPDGDAPANPSPEGVAEVMVSSAGTVLNLLREWNLDDDIDVVVGNRASFKATARNRGRRAK